MIETMLRSRYEREHLQQFSREALARYQLLSLNQLLSEILPRNRFYQAKLGDKRHLDSLDQLAELPFTLKEELIGNSESGFAANLTYDVDHYVRFHRTSGTRGRPLVVLDAAEDWDWWLETWQFVLDAAQIESYDRVFMAFSFGPFIGFWSAHDAAIARGALVIPGGGLGSLARLELMQTAGSTVMFCTPSYALHLAEVAKQNSIDIAASQVSRIVVAGEPGGSIPAVRQRIESAWNARVIDHSGASEIGPWGFADPEGRGLFVNESEFIAEFFAVESGQSAGEGELAELVLTTLGRPGCPTIRYRTGDLVRPVWQHENECRFVLLDGGVLGRVDDMMVIRGVNIYPGSIEQVLRSFPEILEYRLTAHKNGEMDALTIEIEDELNDPQRVATELNLRIGLKIDVRTVPLGTLPRFDAKGKRFIDLR